jgi:hypothetical protein
MKVIAMLIKSTDRNNIVILSTCTSRVHCHTVSDHQKYHYSNLVFILLFHLLQIIYFKYGILIFVQTKITFF